MNKQNKNTNSGSLQTAETKGKFSVSTDYELWSFLLPKRKARRKHKLSKGEAFLDLINRQRLWMLTNDDSYIDGGIQALANAWTWDRTTVKKFIDSLVNLGVAELKNSGNKTIVTLTNVTYLPHNGSDT